MVREVSPNGYSDAYGPNVANILAQGTRIVRGPIPARVRKDLSAAVKDGVLGRLPKDGLKPEIFFHPRHTQLAREMRAEEAIYSIACIAKCVA